MATFTNTQRGCKKLVHDGFTYNKIRTAPTGRIYWRCDEAKLGCKGTAITVPDRETRVGLAHNHPPSESRVSYKVLKSEIKKAAADIRFNTRHIVESAMEKVSPDVEISSNFQETAKQIIKRKRKSMLGCVNPTTSSEVNLPLNLRLTKTAEGFVLEDTGTSDPNRIIILGSDTDLSRLLRCQVWAVNGAFKSDECWYHLWVIYGVYKDVTVPLVYCLLLSNQEDSYERALDLILTKSEEGSAPTVLIFDFDKTTKFTFTNQIPGIKLHGCFYTFVRCIWRKIKELDLVENYENDDYIKIIMKSFAALAFVPPEEVELTFESLVEELTANTDGDDSYKPFVDYFVSKWIGRRKRKIYPEFPIDMWNNSNVSMEGLPQSINPTEPWRYTFSSIFHNYHSTIYRLIEELSRQQAKVHSICEKLDKGTHVQLFTTAEFKSANESLFAISADYDRGEIGEFLRACCNHIDYTDKDQSFV